jgi:hypothetical protein
MIVPAARALTREEQGIMREAWLKSVAMLADEPGDMQDGMLAHYLEQVKLSNVNVKARLDREPFDYRRGLIASRSIIASS